VEAGFPKRSCSNKENHAVGDVVIATRVDVSIVSRDPKPHRRDGKRASESPIAIRPKSSFWRASARLERCDHENFFVAKPCDSESVRTSF
jgi:hypothetical protein